MDLWLGRHNNCSVRSASVLPLRRMRSAIETMIAPWMSTGPRQNPKSPEDNARTRWLRLHEVVAIAEKSPEWLCVIVKFAVATGMRLGGDLRSHPGWPRLRH